MSTTVKLLSAEELLHMPDDGFCYELVDGELIKMSPPGSEHGAITANITALLIQYAKIKRLGVVFGAETGFQIGWNPDTVLAPDVAFIRRQRIPVEGLPKGYWPGPPDLAVEVLSPDDSPKSAREKAEKWIAAGTVMVWTVNPRKRTVVVQGSGGPPVTLTETSLLNGGEVLPGFRCRVTKLFASSQG